MGNRRGKTYTECFRLPTKLLSDFGMNNRILLVAAVAGLAIIIGIVGFSGQLIINDVSEGGIIQMSEHGSTGVKPLIMDLEELDISYVDEKFATLNLRFTVSNPNYKSVILQFVKYEIIESGSSIHTGQIGERYDGFITSSNYFTILGEGSTSLSDTITLRSAYNEVELWESIASGDLNWQVKGQAYYSLSSMTAGGENIMDFVLTP